MTREPESNATLRAAMEAPVKKRQTGQTLVLVGILLLAFDLVSVLFVPSDVRAGHHFWTILFAIDVVIACGLVVTGFILKAKVKSRLNV